jgi:glycosyltransferase involved in cell wall biosynthesis
MPDFAGGGAETMSLKLATAMSLRGFDVTIVVHQMDGDLKLLVPQNVGVVSLNVGRTLRALFPLVGYMRTKKPDLLLANLGANNVMAILAGLLAGVRTRIVVTQHNSLEMEANLKRWQFRLLPLAYRLFLRFADGIVAVSKGVGDEVARIAMIARDRVTVIHNGIIDPEFACRAAMVANHPWITDGGAPFILAVGRLVEQKDFGTLLEAFAQVAKVRDVRLIILGKGTEGEVLKGKAQALGIAPRVSFAGFDTNPMAFMRHAALLVLSSRFEGFGNVLVESLACGTPVVSTDCPHGPTEILDGGRFGRLVPVGDSAALAGAILATLDTEPNREELMARGRQFTSERASALYESLFISLHFGREEFSAAGRPEY